MSFLTEPLTLPCGLVLPGRLALAPLTNLQSHADGTLSEVELGWLQARARGGFPLVSTCAAYVSEEGKAWKGQLGVARDAHLPGLTRLAAAIKAEGSVGIVQLHHAGAKATLAPAGKLTTADDPEQGLRRATPADLARVRADYVAAALRAEAAGFDGVEVHGANGYLFTQFLAPEDNPRIDAYGGSLENRARLLRETIQAVRAAVRPDFCVGVRLSPVDLWAQRGLVLADSVQLGQWLAEDGVDFVHLSLKEAAGRPPHEPDSPVVVTAFREALPEDVALFAVGRVTSAQDARAAMDAGASVVVVGRAGIAHADLPRLLGNPGFESTKPPWSPEYLRAQAVGEDFIAYLSLMAGMVEGGTPARH